MPHVTVVIPLFNAEDVIADTLDSVQKQTWTDYDVVVVDDGSTDASADVVRRHRLAIHYVHQSNRGVAAARNRGISEAKGDHIALLDHDDLWDETKLEKQVAVLDARPEVVMVVTDVAHLDRAGRPMGIVGRSYKPDDRFAALFVKGYIPTPSAAMIRKSVFDAVGGFDERFQSASLDDHELWTRIAPYGEIVNIAEPLTYHRNRTVKPDAVLFAHRALLFETLLARHGEDPEKRRYLLEGRAAWLADKGKDALAQGRRREGRRELMQGLALSLGSGRNLKTAWRCVSRLARSYW